MPPPNDTTTTVSGGRKDGSYTHYPSDNSLFKGGDDSISTTGTHSSILGSSASFQSVVFQSQADLITCPPPRCRKDPEKNNPQEKGYTGVKQYGGMILTIVASVCFSFVTLLVKVLSGHGVDQYGASFWRYLGITLPTIPILLFYGHTQKKKNSIFTTVWPPLANGNWRTWVGLLTRGLIGSTSVILRYYSLQYLDIGDTSVITYSTPVLVTVMAHFCLGERCGVVSVIVAFTTLAGVVIVTKPPVLLTTLGLSEGSEGGLDEGRMIGTALACGSLFCSSLIVIITRKIREVHFAIMILVFGTIGLLQSLLMALTLGTLTFPTALADTFLISGVAGLSFLGQMAIVLALKFEQAGPVALLRSCDVIFGFVLQFAVMGVVPDVWSSVGGTIVLTGVIIIALRKWVGSMPETSWVKRTKWGWFVKWVVL